MKITCSTELYFMGTVCGEHRHIGSTISFTKNRIIVMDLHTSSILYKFLNLYDRTCFMEILYMFLYYSILFNMCIHFLFSIAVHVHLSIIFLFLKSSIFMTLIINTKIHLMFCRNDILSLLNPYAINWKTCHGKCFPNNVVYVTLYISPITCNSCFAVILSLLFAVAIAFYGQVVTSLFFLIYPTNYCFLQVCGVLNNCNLSWMTCRIQLINHD